MDLLRFLVILRGRWRLAICIQAICIAVAVLVSTVPAKQYKASASLIVDTRGADPVEGSRPDGTMTQNLVATQVDVILSDRVARKAAQALQLAEDQVLRKRWQQQTDGIGDFHTWVARQLTEKLDVRPARDSSVIAVTYQGSEPQRVADTVNAVVRAYVDTALELRVEPARLNHQFFAERVERSRQTLAAAQGRLAAFQRENGLVPTDGRVDLETTRLAELSSQVVALQSASAEAAGRSAQARGSVERLREVTDNGAVSALVTEIARQEANLSEGVSRLGERHPTIIEQRARLQTLQDRLLSHSQRLSGGINANSEASAVRLSILQSLAEQQRGLLSRLRSERDEAAVLLGDVDAARRSYELVQTRASQTNIESLLSHVNISVLQHASPPIRAVLPRTGLNLGAAVVIGFLLAAGAVLMRERWDTRIRRPLDVVEGLRVPLLAMIHRNERRSRVHSMSPALPQHL